MEESACLWPLYGLLLLALPRLSILGILFLKCVIYRHWPYCSCNQVRRFLASCVSQRHWNSDILLHICGTECNSGILVHICGTEYAQCCEIQDILREAQMIIFNCSCHKFSKYIAITSVVTYSAQNIKSSCTFPLLILKKSSIIVQRAIHLFSFFAK